MTKRIYDPLAKLLALVVSFFTMFFGHTLIVETKAFWGLIPNHTLIWAPYLVGIIVGVMLYRRTTRLLACPSGCGHRVDVLARQCPRCGCPLAAQ